MKFLIALLFVIYTSTATSQQKTCTISLMKSIKLAGVIEKFNATKHKIDTCSYEFSFKYIYRIDGKKWYGGDQELELPRTQLKQLTVYINNQPVSLEVSGMFNPGFDYGLIPKQFHLNKKAKDYFLYGFFSDGAGAYTVHWKIVKGKSTRLKISTDEKDFSWQISASRPLKQKE